MSPLTEAQRDGRACIECGGEMGSMVPVDMGRPALGTTQLFKHPSCNGPSRYMPCRVLNEELAEACLAAERDVAQWMADHPYSQQNFVLQISAFGEIRQRHHLDELYAECRARNLCGDHR